MNVSLTTEQMEQIKKDILGKHFDFKFEKNKLKSHLGDWLYEQLKESKAIVAGGMITSIFTNNEINDVDVYFRNYNHLYQFADSALYNCHVVAHTNKATQFISKYGSKEVLTQIIHYRTYDKPEDIFNTYDYTICMGAFDFATEQFVLHPDFLKHNAQRILRFNSNTSYPLISAIRKEKYESRGYKISKAEHFRILMTCMKLSITSYDELKEQLGGMYGENYDRLFDDVKDEEFDLLVAIERIANFSKSEDYFKEYRPIEYNINDIKDDLDKGERFVVKLLDGKEYRVIDGKAVGEYESEKEYAELDVSEFYNGQKFYKFVEKVDGKLRSFYRSSFKYEIGEEVKAEKTYVQNSYSKEGRIFFNRIERIDDMAYACKANGVLLELEVLGEDVISDTKSEVTATKVKVIREVPEDEWNKEKVVPYKDDETEDFPF